MENEKDLKYSWGLVLTTPPYFSPVRLPGLSFIYRTEKIEKPTTAGEIWKSSKSFLKETTAKYNTHDIEGENPILTTYKILVSWKEEPNSKPTKEKILYSSIWKIEGERKNKIEEKKKFRASETIEPNFYIFLVPTVYIFRERKHTPGENIEEEKKNIFKLSRCCICKKKAPNVLFCRCFHRVVCDSCDLSEKIRYCPICKNNLQGTRKETYFKKNYYSTSPIIPPHKPF